MWGLSAFSVLDGELGPAENDSPAVPLSALWVSMARATGLGPSGPGPKLALKGNMD